MELVEAFLYLFLPLGEQTITHCSAAAAAFWITAYNFFPYTHNEKQIPELRLFGTIVENMHTKHCRFFWHTTFVWLQLYFIFLFSGSEAFSFFSRYYACFARVRVWAHKFSSLSYFFNWSDAKKRTNAGIQAGAGKLK